MSPSARGLCGTTLAVFLALVVLPSAAFGQATRTWVSGVGDDVNPCSRTAPCKTFAGAISKTAAKGEINTLDSGGFGAVTITKSITIRNRGPVAGVLTNAANAINISAGVNDRVNLIGLAINGLDTAANGVKINSGKVVRIVDCDIHGFATAGVSYTPSTANARLFILNSSIFNNTAGSGVAIRPTAAGGLATIRRTEIEDNSYGVVVNGDVQPAVAQIFDSTVSDSTNAAIFSLSSLGLVRLGRNSITGNGTGLSTGGGSQIVSYGNNEVTGNATDGDPTGTIVPKR
jgi:hypothetical protein